MKIVADVKTIVATEATNELNEALTSTWTLTSASFILLSGQIGFTLLELAQTSKKNKDFTVMKNFLVFIVSLITWFVMGYAVCFGTDPDVAYPSFVGFRHGWFADFSGGLNLEGEDAVDQKTYDDTLLFN